MILYHREELGLNEVVECLCLREYMQIHLLFVSGGNYQFLV